MTEAIECVNVQRKERWGGALDEGVEKKKYKKENTMDKMEKVQERCCVCFWFFLIFSALPLRGVYENM